MIDEEKLRKKLADLWKRTIPVTPSSFAEADSLIDEVIEASKTKQIKAPKATE